MTTWNPSDKSAGIDLSGGNLIATRNSTAAPLYASTRANTWRGGGKYYLEWRRYSPTSYIAVGFGLATATLPLDGDAYCIGNTSDSIGVFSSGVTNTVIWNNGGAIATFVGMTSQPTDDICVALDLDSKLIWVRINNGLWNGAVGADPATGAGGVSIAALTGSTWYPASSLYNYNETCTARFFSFNYAAPNGFLPWASMTASASLGPSGVLDARPISRFGLSSATLPITSGMSAFLTRQTSEANFDITAGLLAQPQQFSFNTATLPAAGNLAAFGSLAGRSTISIAGTTSVTAITDHLRPYAVLNLSGRLFAAAAIIRALVSTPSIDVRSDIDEIEGIVERFTEKLLSFASPKGREATNLRQAAGVLNANVGKRLINGTLSAAMLEVFSAAVAANLPLGAFDTTIAQLMAEDPSDGVPITATQAAIVFALSAECRIISAMTFHSRDDVERVMSKMKASFDAAKDLAADEMDNDAYNRLVALGASLARHLADTGLPLPRVVDYSLSPLPALALAHRIYADASRADELVKDNKIVHPAFMPPSFRALSS